MEVQQFGQKWTFEKHAKSQEMSVSHLILKKSRWEVLSKRGASYLPVRLPYSSISF